MQQQGYEQLSEDMQKALDDSVKLINGDQKELNKVAAQMLALLETNGVDEKEVIEGIIAETGTAIRPDTEAMLNETLTVGDDDSLGLLSDLNVSTTEGADGIVSAVMDVAEAIENQEVTVAISDLNPEINRYATSSGNQEGKLTQIDQDINHSYSTGGTTADTALGNKSIADSNKIAEYQKKKADLETKIAALDKQIDSSQEHLEALQKKHEAYNEHINERKARLKEVKKITDTKKRDEKIKQVEAQIASLREKRDAYVASEKKTKQTIADLQKQRDALQKELDGFAAYASGRKKINQDELAWTNENLNKLGAEMIVRKSDGAILTPLKANDSVIPANLADNLFKWGAISPDKFLSNPFLGKMGNMQVGDAEVNNNVNQSIEMHFDSLFTIEGDVTPDVMDRLEEFGKALTSNKKFQQNVVQFVTKDFVRESRKQGGFR